MTEQELWELIKNVEANELHQAPDYLKSKILKKANQASKQTQIIIYSIKTITATVAALMILFTIPNNLSENRFAQQQDKIEIQISIRNNKKFWQEKYFKEKNSITNFLNKKTSDVCNQLLTILEEIER